MKLSVKPTVRVQTTVIATIKEEEIPLYSNSKEFHTLTELKEFLENCYQYVAKQLED